MAELKDFLKSIQNNDDSIESIVANAKKNKYLKPIIAQYDLSDDEIARYYAILDTYAIDKEAEEKCPGIDNCSLPSPHRISVLKMQDGTLVREIAYCPCYQKIIDRKKGYIVSDFDPSLLKLNVNVVKRLNNGKIIINNLGLAHKDATKRWTFINDTDHIASKYVVPYLSWCSEKGFTVAYVDYPKLIERLKSFTRFQIDDFNNEIEKLQNVDVLVLENFGAEYKSDYNRDAVLMPILRTRSIKKAETVLISAFERNDIKDLYSGSSPSGRVAVKELDNILSSNTCKEAVIKAGIEEQF